MITFERTAKFTVLTCGECHVEFAMTNEMYRRRVEDKKRFYCPNGHCRVFNGESASDKAQRLAGQLDMERTRRQAAEKTADYAIRSRKAVSTRLRKVKQRVGHGVCPCCNRTFKQLAAHMEMKHPGYAAELQS